MGSAAEMSTRKGTRRCWATGTTAAVSPELNVPMRSCAPALIRRSASARATSALVCVSPRISSILAPPMDLMPPAALMASAAIWAPRRHAWPGSARGPVTQCSVPIFTVGACARRTAGKPATTAVPAAAPAVLRKVLRSVFPARRRAVIVDSHLSSTCFSHVDRGPVRLGRSLEQLSFGLMVVVGADHCAGA